jgi:hypothetical protein
VRSRLITSALILLVPILAFALLGTFSSLDLGVWGYVIELGIWVVGLTILWVRPRGPR